MAKTITFKKDQDLERIDALLSGTRIRNRMPDAVRGKRSAMTLWAIEYLTKLIDGGVDNLQSELFANNSEEWEVITRENERLKVELNKLQGMSWVKKIYEQDETITNLQKNVDELTAAVDTYIDNINTLMAENRQFKEQLKTQR